ncbi:hypothetical protein CAPTEDRAFT_47512, partial [Capitella teleta]
NKLLTLAFVTRKSEVLLGLKKKGFGMGRWNGFGGKVEKGETISEAAKREMQEECGLIVDDFKKVGLLMFEFVGDPQLLEVHVFHSETFRGKCIETEEMRPMWYPLDGVPFDQMWPDDYLWFPHFLARNPFFGYITFQGMDNIVQSCLK